MSSQRSGHRMNLTRFFCAECQRHIHWRGSLAACCRHWSCYKHKKDWFNKWQRGWQKESWGHWIGPVQSPALNQCCRQSHITIHQMNNNQRLTRLAIVFFTLISNSKSFLIWFYYQIQESRAYRQAVRHNFRLNSCLVGPSRRRIRKIENQMKRKNNK